MFGRSRVQQEPAKVVDLVELMRISIDVDDDVEQRQEAHVAADLAHDRSHLQLLLPFAAQCSQLPFAQRLWANVRSCGEWRWLLHVFFIVIVVVVEAEVSAVVEIRVGLSVVVGLADDTREEHRQREDLPERERERDRWARMRRGVL